MALRVVEVIVPSKCGPAIRKVFDENKPIDVWRVAESEEGGRRLVIRALIEPDAQQETVDALQDALSGTKDWRMVVSAVDAAIPKPEFEESIEKNIEKTRRRAFREVVYTKVEKGACLDADYLMFVALSTIVAAAALVTDNVAVLIGAMVIAPFLGPNLAFSFGAALGDKPLMQQAAVTAAVGGALAIAMCAVAGALMPLNFEAEELLARTELDHIALAVALASGACAALALTSGASSSLVGVMVAVALLPPAATVGLMLGHGDLYRALGALSLLVANIACVNLSALIVFRIRGIEPRNWLEKRAAHQSQRVALFAFSGLILALALMIYLQQHPELLPV